MKVVAIYNSPSSFSYKPPSYRAGNSLILSCEVDKAEDRDDGLFYEWTSSCEGNCFSRGGTLQTVSSRIFTNMTKEFTLVWSMIKEVPVAMPASL